MTADKITKVEPPYPLGWSLTKHGTEVSLHLTNASTIANSLCSLDGEGMLESLPHHAVGTFMWLVSQEIQAVRDILERGDAS